MFRMKFYNDCGEIIFGGGRDRESWRVTNAEGLCLPPRSFTSCTYDGVCGQEICTRHISARYITLSGDILAGDNFDAEFSAAMSVLGREGVLEIDTKSGKRRIKAECCEFVEGKREGKYHLFTVQFMCGYPFFENPEAVLTPVYKAIPNLSADFEFDDKFSARISRRNVFYRGGSETEPVFIITCGSDTSGELSIINHTGGEHISFDYSPLAGEVITVDVENRRIYNSDGDDLIEYLTDDSFFDGFHLYPGDNDIEVYTGTADRQLEVMCRYHEKFAEVVV